MKNTGKTIVSIFALAVAMTFSSCGYNGLVDKREAVEGQWANVENQYQRRSDLVPNLVASVKGYARHEEKVLTEIAESRSKLGGSFTVDPSITEDEEKFAQYQKAQNAFGATVGRLLSLTETYPQLKADENFLALQSQLEGTENRIAVERKRYNDMARDYNSSIQKFPGVISARMFHFEKKAYFAAEESAKKAPTVSFD